jgi:hypothetical protein
LACFAPWRLENLLFLSSVFFSSVTYPFKRIHDVILHEYLIAVRWAPVLYGQDAGRGTIVEVIIHGSVTRHGMTKHATPAAPLLDIKVHGKNLHVIRHGSSGIPA